MIEKVNKLIMKKFFHKHNKVNINNTLGYNKPIDGLSAIESIALREKFFSNKLYEEMKFDAALITSIENKESEYESGTILVIQMTKKLNSEEISNIKSQITLDRKLSCSVAIFPFKKKLDRLMKEESDFIELLEQNYEWFV